MNYIFPPESFSDFHLIFMWDVINEYPQFNFSDDGPQTKPAFFDEMRERKRRGELLIIVEDANTPIGFVGFAPLSARMGQFHGIAFAKKVHGTGVAQEAVQHVLDELFRAGMEKVCAFYYADNTRMASLFQKLGFEIEGLLKKHATVGGVLRDLQIVAKFK